MREINKPEVVAELQAIFERYEAALIANDAATLNGMFWNNPSTIRFGVGEILYGYEAIANFRSAGPGISGRTLRNTVITSYGDDFATISTEFQREGQTKVGRQMQTWARFPEGWRIVAAHVSLMGA
jgi:hypothetical protein